MSSLPALSDAEGEVVCALSEKVLALLQEEEPLVPHRAFLGYAAVLLAAAAIASSVRQPWAADLPEVAQLVAQAMRDNRIVDADFMQSISIRRK
jgi:hypothetical protein